MTARDVPHRASNAMGRMIDRLSWPALITCMGITLCFTCVTIAYQYGFNQKQTARNDSSCKATNLRFTDAVTLYRNAELQALQLGSDEDAAANAASDGLAVRTHKLAYDYRIAAQYAHSYADQLRQDFDRSCLTDPKHGTPPTPRPYETPILFEKRD